MKDYHQIQKWRERRVIDVDEASTTPLQEESFDLSKVPSRLT